MWNNYFFQIQKKYSMRLKYKEPLVIRFDGQNVTKNKSINLFYGYKGGFINSLEKAVQYFTSKYKCYAIFGSDEVSFIFIDPMLLLEDLTSEKNNYSNETISLFSQYLFDYFNSIYKEQKVFWHGKCFSIPQDKINSYIKYRSGIIKNVMATYFLKRNNVRFDNLKLADKLKECIKFNEYNILGDAENGFLYFKGRKLDLQEFLKGNIKEVNVIEKDNLTFNNSNEKLKEEYNDDDFSIEFVDF